MKHKPHHILRSKGRVWMTCTCGWKSHTYYDPNTSVGPMTDFGLHLLEQSDIPVIETNS